MKKSFFNSPKKIVIFLSALILIVVVLVVLFGSLNRTRQQEKQSSAFFGGSIGSFIDPTHTISDDIDEAIDATLPDIINDELKDPILGGLNTTFPLEMTVFEITTDAAREEFSPGGDNKIVGNSPEEVVESFKRASNAENCTTLGSEVYCYFSEEEIKIGTKTLSETTNGGTFGTDDAGTAGTGAGIDDIDSSVGSRTKRDGGSNICRGEPCDQDCVTYWDNLTLCTDAPDPGLYDSASCDLSMNCYRGGGCPADLGYRCVLKEEGTENGFCCYSSALAGGSGAVECSRSETKCGNECCSSSQICTNVNGQDRCACEDSGDSGGCQNNGMYCDLATDQCPTGYTCRSYKLCGAGVGLCYEESCAGADVDAGTESSSRTSRSAVSNVTNTCDSADFRIDSGDKNQTIYAGATPPQIDPVYVNIRGANSTGSVTWKVESDTTGSEVGLESMIRDTVLKLSFTGSTPMQDGKIKISVVDSADGACYDEAVVTVGNGGISGSEGSFGGGLDQCDSSEFGITDPESKTQTVAAGTTPSEITRILANVKGVTEGFSTNVGWELNDNTTGVGITVSPKVVGNLSSASFVGDQALQSGSFKIRVYDKLDSKCQDVATVNIIGSADQNIAEQGPTDQPSQSQAGSLTADSGPENQTSAIGGSIDGTTTDAGADVGQISPIDTTDASAAVADMNTADSSATGVSGSDTALGSGGAITGSTGTGRNRGGIAINIDNENENEVDTDTDIDYSGTGYAGGGKIAPKTGLSGLGIGILLFVSFALTIGVALVIKNKNLFKR